MLEEKLLKKIKTINENFINLGFDLEEDLIELVTQREDIKDRIENTKYKKMTFSKDEEANSYILNLEDCQISFDIIEGEDEQGPWFEIECKITIIKILFIISISTPYPYQKKIILHSTSNQGPSSSSPSIISKLI